MLSKIASYFALLMFSVVLSACGGGSDKPKDDNKTKVNTPPVANADTATTEQNQAIVIAVLANDSDANKDALSLASVGQASHGEASISNGAISYTPDNGFAGQDSFSYQISDGKGGIASASVTVDISNLVPVAGADEVVIDVNDVIAIDVLANDLDVSGDTLNIQAFSEPAFGSLVKENNLISYTPAEDFVGQDTFSYTVSDSYGATDSAIVEVIVNNVAPGAENDLVETQQSTAIELDVLANDSSKANHQLTIVSTSSPGHGAVNLEENMLTYTPVLGYVGQDSFAYVIRDELGDEATATVAVTVVNTEPVAADDSVTTTQNQAVEFTPLDNDTDALGDVLTISGLAAAEFGVAVLEDNVVSYTPNTGYSGLDTFTYTMVDGYGAVSSASITVDVANNLPIANDDTARVFKNGNLTIDVLANDTDVEGDTLSIQSVSDPVNGSASIVGGKISYVPNTDFTGEDVFGYILVDSYGASTSGFISIKVNNGINVSGKLVGFAEAGTRVTLAVGEQEYTGATDTGGNFTIEIDGENPDALIIARAESVTDHYSLYAYLGDVAGYLAEMGDTFAVSGKDLSSITTAEYELVNYVQEEENPGVAISSSEGLSTARFLLDGDIVLKLAVSAELINASNGIELPDSYASINAFMQAPFAMQKQLSVWREQQSVEYYSAFASLFESAEMTSSPDDLTQTSNILFKSTKTSTLHSTINLTLKAGGAGFYSNVDTALTWDRGSDQLDISLENATDVIRHEYFYCGNNANQQVSFSSQNMSFKFLYATPDYDVYIRKIVGNFADSACLDSGSHTIEYDTLHLAHQAPLDMAAGRYYFESIKKAPDGDDVDYDYISAAFELSENGRFVETIDSVIASREGNWQVLDNKLRLDYDDGVSVVYSKTGEFKGFEQLSYQTLESDVVVAARDTLLVPEQNLTWDNSIGFMAPIESPLFDAGLHSNFGLLFNGDNSGVQRNYNDAQWQDSSISRYTWSLNSNRYKLDYYFNTYSSEFVNYCDESEEICLRWRRREIEVIGQVDGYFILKIYQEYLPNDVITSTFRGGYIALFSFSE